MHGLQLLHKTLSNTCPKIHNIRLSSLFTAVNGLLHGQTLTLVNIGRHIKSDAQVKHKIKQIDRLLGNKHLYQERSKIYQSLVNLLIKENSQPIILIDWSGVTQCGKFYMIRASLPFEGRALTIYDEVYPESKRDSPIANKIFLNNLKLILPNGCRPIIVTDAGFRNPWFKAVREMSWDFVGRIRSETQLKNINQNDWNPCKDLYKQATLKPQHLGQFLLAKSNPLTCQMYLIKGKTKNRKKTNLKGHRVRCSSSLKHAKRNKEPWLIATSLAIFSAKKIIYLYKLRMCIEQGFRDIKNYRNGLCLRETRSTTVERLSILLLIGALATYIICVYGQLCQLSGNQYQLQTNSVKHYKVLSWFSLGYLTIKLNIILRDSKITHIINLIASKVCYCE